ncbi:MAG: glutathione peroxidase [Rhodospirillaceae bacterium]|nr:MAG: glutathione peroxidase [Rhodospirillaceae bacterium]
MTFLLGLFASLPASQAGAANAQTAHDFTFKTIDGKPLPLSQYKGKAVLLVNTASLCGFTPQYEGLQALQDQYKDQGLVVLGVPSNDFGKQEPGSSAEIKDFCDINYSITFPLTEKEVVSGDSAHPFYKWAKSELGILAAPKWNFHKYLITPEGKLADWFSTMTKPGSAKVVKAVEAVLR